MRKEIFMHSAKKSKGFTLIELLTIVVIISILALIALPVYFSYTVRTKISEGLAIVPPVMKGVTEFYYIKGEWPANNTEAGVAPSAEYTGGYVDSIRVEGPPDPSDPASKPKIIITFDITELPPGQDTIVYTPSGSSGSAIFWDCVTESTVPVYYRPSVCR